MYNLYELSIPVNIFIYIWFFMGYSIGKWKAVDFSVIFKQWLSLPLGFESDGFFCGLQFRLILNIFPKKPHSYQMGFSAENDVITTVKPLWRYFFHSVYALTDVKIIMVIIIWALWWYNTHSTHNTTHNNTWQTASLAVEMFRCVNGFQSLITLISNATMNDFSAVEWLFFYPARSI